MTARFEESPHDFDDEARVAPVHVIFVEEAKGRWCPEARRPWGEEGTGYAAANRVHSNRGGDIDDFRWTSCIADRCMFWQWHDDDQGYCAKACSPLDHHRLTEKLRAEYRQRIVKLRADWQAQTAKAKAD